MYIKNNLYFCSINNHKISMPMKNKSLIIIALLFANTFASAQYVTIVTSDISTVLPSNYTYVGPVRNWTGTDYTLSTVSGEGALAFVAIDHSDFVNGLASPQFPLYKADIYPTIHGLYDFCIAGNLACFCCYRVDIDPVTYTSIQTCYIGWFDMNELVSGPTVHYNLMEIARASSFHRIEAFNDAYGFKIYALGTYWDGTQNNPTIYEIDDPPSATAYNYVHLDVQLPLKAERMDEIVILEDEVVFIGRDNIHPFPSPSAINMRKINKASGLNDPQLEDLYLYSNPIISQWEYNGAIHATYLGDDKFVVSYTFSDDYDLVSYNRIRVFDNQLSNINSQQYVLEDKLSLYDLTYNRGNKTLTISEPWQGTSRFVFTKPQYTSGYTALSLYNPNIAYGSIDTISTKQFVSSDIKHWLMQHADLLSYNPQAIGNNCMNDGEIKIWIIPNIVPQQQQPTITVDTEVINFIYPYKPTTNYILDFKCKSE